MRLLLCLTGCLFLILGTLVGCEDEGDHHAYGYGYGDRDGRGVPYGHEYRGYQGAYHEAGYFVVQRPEVWKTLWGGQPPTDVNVDFTKQSVLVAMMGQVPTEGYDIRINDVRDTGKRIEVYVSTKQPNPKNVQKQLVGYPYDMMVMPKLKTPVFFTVAGTDAQLMAIQDLYEGVQCCCTEAQTAVVRNPDAWKAFWTKNIDAQAAAPEVDFTQFMAVAVFTGQKATTGYTAHITAAAQAQDHLTINYHTQIPKSDDPVEQKATSPYSIVIIPTSALGVNFVNMTPPSPNGAITPPPTATPAGGTMGTLSPAAATPAAGTPQPAAAAPAAGTGTPSADTH